MGRKLELEWREDRDKLESLYKGEQDIQNRTRLQALWLLRCGKTIKEVASVLGVHARTVQEWINWYRTGGLVEVLSRRHGGHSPPQQWLSQEQEEALRAKADAGDFRSIGEAVEWVSKSYQIRYSYWGMRNLFERMKLKKKVPRPSNPKASASEQAAWKKGGSPLL